MKNMRLYKIPETEYTDAVALNKYIGRRGIITSQENTPNGYNHGGTTGQIFVIKGTDEWNGYFLFTITGGKRVDKIHPRDIEVEPITLAEHQQVLDTLREQRKALLQHMLFLRNTNIPNYDSQQYIVWKLQKMRDSGADLVLVVLKFIGQTSKFIDFLL